MSKKKARKAVPQASGNSGAATDKSTKVPQRDKIGFDLSISQRADLTDKQKELIHLILDKNTKVVFLSGPAGTSKTYVSVLAGLMLMQKRAVSDILYIRSVVESASRSLGYLPGEAGMKMEPYTRPLHDKMEEMLPKCEVDRLVKENRIEGIPVNFLRGASFNAKFIISDESQNETREELLTILTRVGQFSKIVICGDPSQSDIGSKSAFQKTFDMFNDEESRENGIHCFSFTKDDIVRSKIVKYIVERFERKEMASVKNEPMFPPK
jgi:phosphate starvation-inducible PhoH-like protein